MEAYVVDIMMKANERTFCDSNKNHMRIILPLGVSHREQHIRTYVVLVVYRISVTAK